MSVRDWLVEHAADARHASVAFEHGGGMAGAARITVYLVGPRRHEVTMDDFMLCLMWLDSIPALHGIPVRVSRFGWATDSAAGKLAAIFTRGDR